MIKRLLSALIAVSVITGVASGLCATAETSEIIYVEETFDGGELSDWNVDKREGDYSIIYDEEEGNYYLASWGEGLSDYSKFPQLVKNLPKAIDRGTLRVSFKARSSNPKGNCMIDVTNDVLWSACNIVFRTAGTLTFNEYVVLNKFEPGRWYDIDLYFNVDKRTFDAYLDGQLVVKSGKFKTDGVNDLVSFKTTGWFIEDEKAQLDVDDLLITDYTEQLKQEELEEKPYNETLNMLNALGVIDERGVIEFDGSRVLTRAEYLRYLIGLSEISENQLGGTVQELFVDVPIENEYARLVAWAHSRGIIMMNSEKLFNPDAPIKSIDAIVMLVRMAGYSPQVSLTGGYVEGYLNTAYEIDLIESGFDISGTLTCDMMLELFKNALDVEVMQLFLSGELNYQVKPGDTMAKIYKKLEKVEGVVTANSKTGIVNATGAKVNALEINKIEYPCYNTDYENYLGYYVEAYIDIDSENEVLYAIPNERNITFSLKKNDYTDIYIDGNYIRYSDGTSKEKALNIKLPYIIYNGKAYDAGLTDELININNGTITFISNNRDNVYDVISINEAEHIIFSSADIVNEIIYGTLGEKYVLDDDYKLYRDNEEITLSELKNGDVLSIRKTISNSDETYVITTLRNTKYGAIKAADSEQIKIDDDYYYLSQEYKKYGITPRVGFAGAFYFDCDGNVLYFKDDIMASSGKKSGYIISGKYSPDDELYYISYANINGGYEKRALSEKVKINGTKTDATMVEQELLSTGEKVNETPTVKQLFDFWVNDEGQITRINTDAYTVDFTNSERTLYNTGKTLYTGTSGQKTVFIGKNTIVYQVPEDYPDNYEYYGRVATTGFKEGVKFKVSAYNLDEINVADVILIKEAVNSFTINDTRVVVTDVDEILDDNDEVVTQVTAMVNGIETIYKTSAECNFPDVPYGTVVAIKLNQRNEISAFEKQNNLSSWKSQSVSGSYNETQFCSGTVKSANNDGCLIDVNGTEYPYLYNTNFKAYLIDTNRHTCTLLSNSAVGAYISSRNSDAFVYTSGYRGGMWNMYIYVR